MPSQHGDTHHCSTPASGQPRQAASPHARPGRLADSGAVTCTVVDQVARVELARPDKLNGLTLQMLQALVDTAHELAEDRTLRGVILTGQGEAFCAGLDFATVMSDRAGVARAFLPRPWRGAGTNLFQEACWSWRRVPVPVVAAVHGHCLGGGLQIAMGADLRFTTADARWSVLEAKWGIIPDMSGVHTLSQQVGMDVAKRLAMTGEIIDGSRAVELGVATEVATDPVAAAQEFLGLVATRSPDSVAAVKRIVDQTWTASARRTFARERWEQARLLVNRNTAIAQRVARGAAALDYRPRAGRDPRG